MKQQTLVQSLREDPDFLPESKERRRKQTGEKPSGKQLEGKADKKKGWRGEKKVGGGEIQVGPDQTIPEI